MPPGIRNLTTARWALASGAIAMRLSEAGKGRVRHPSRHLRVLWLERSPLQDLPHRASYRRDAQCPRCLSLEHHLQPGVTDEWRRPRPDVLHRIRQYGTDRMSAGGLKGQRAGMESQVVFHVFGDAIEGQLASLMSAVAR